MEKKLLGRVDKLDFPDMNLFNIDVKIDTGAYTSAIHCTQIIEKDNTLICTFFSDGHLNFNSSNVVFNDYSYTDVKSSNGYKENRYKIKTSVLIFGIKRRINLTLSTRADMKFPVLIGRQFLKTKFIVDVDLMDQSYNLKTK